MGFVFFRPRPPEPPYDYSAVKDPCPQCRHEKSAHPRPGQTNLTKCVICIWEEDTDQRETGDMCALRFGEPLMGAGAHRTVEPRLKPFDRGAVVLRDGIELVGHVVSVVSSFWSPLRPLRKQSCVWFTVIWADGQRENPFDDYPPGWFTVEEIESGRFIWSQGTHQGEYKAEILGPEAAAATWDELGVTPSDL